MIKEKETLEKLNLKTQQKMVKKRYAWAVKNMLKHVFKGTIIKQENQYELKQREVETKKRINERIMKKKEEIKNNLIN